MASREYLFNRKFVFSSLNFWIFFSPERFSDYKNDCGSLIFVSYFYCFIFFINVKKSTFDAREKYFLFHSKTSFRSCDIKISKLYGLKFQYAIKCTVRLVFLKRYRNPTNFSKPIGQYIPHSNLKRIYYLLSKTIVLFVRNQQ